ncbi:HAD family phosphatase [Candidatus Woesearchaeota archaeon]|nr:HAD family phosphatase [Candidatus Woesearchaeota archaeon]
MLKAVIFDQDGVIAESEIGRFQHLKRLAKERGLHGLEEKEHLKHLIGHRSVDLLKAVFGEKISQEVAEEIAGKRRVEFQEKPQEFIREVSGIRETCQELEGEYELAVASTNTRPIVEATLKHLNLRKYFKVVITGSDVIKVKPDPEVYLKTLEALNRKSAECIAVEDSETGLTAAKKAGIKTVGLRNRFYEHHGYRPDLSKADTIIDDIRALPKLIRGEQT